MPEHEIVSSAFSFLLVESKFTEHYVFESLTPEIYHHTVNALNSNSSWRVLNYNGGGKAARINRRRACYGFEACESNVRSRDEFPFACTTQGGKGAKISCVLITEQKIQAIMLGAATRPLMAGDLIIIIPISNEGNRYRIPAPVPA